MENFKLNDLFFEADELIKQNRISEAQKMLLEMVANEPTFAKAHNHLGWIYETRLKDLSKAEEHYKKALESNPEFDAVYYNYAIVLSTQKRWKELEQLLNKAKTLSHINLSVVNNELGIMQEVQGNYEQAVHYYKETVKACLEMKNVNIYKDSILRCKQKQEIDTY